MSSRILAFVVVSFLSMPAIASVARPFDEDCARLSLSATNVLKTEFHLTQLTVDFDASEICEQMMRFGNSVGFEAAVREAMQSFLNDARDSESPLALSLGMAFDEARQDWQEPVPPAVMRRAREILIDHLDRPTTTLRLLKVDETPEHGESVSANWIFLVRIRDLSDHLQWAVVDRAGQKGTNNYGFN